MTRTFLVAVNVPDDGSEPLEATQMDIEDALDQFGVDFESVKLWQSPSGVPPGPILPPPAL